MTNGEFEQLTLFSTTQICFQFAVSDQPFYLCLFWAKEVNLLPTGKTNMMHFDSSKHVLLVFFVKCFLRTLICPTNT